MLLCVSTGIYLVYLIYLVYVIGAGAWCLGPSRVWAGVQLAVTAWVRGADAEALREKHSWTAAELAQKIVPQCSQSSNKLGEDKDILDRCFRQAT